MELDHAVDKVSYSDTNSIRTSNSKSVSCSVHSFVAVAAYIRKKLMLATSIGKNQKQETQGRHNLPWRTVIEPFDNCRFLHQRWIIPFCMKRVIIHVSLSVSLSANLGGFWKQFMSLSTIILLQPSLVFTLRWMTCQTDYPSLIWKRLMCIWNEFICTVGQRMKEKNHS